MPLKIAKTMIPRFKSSNFSYWPLPRPAFDQVLLPEGVLMASAPMAIERLDDRRYDHNTLFEMATPF